MSLDSFKYVSNVGVRSRGWPKTPFSIATSPRCRDGRYFFPYIVPVDAHFILLSVKQGSIKNYF